MSEPENLVPTPPTSAVRNTVGKRNEQIFRDPNGPASDVAFREYCDKYYHRLLPIIVEKVHQEKVQHEKLKEVKARLNFEGCSRKNSKIQEVLQHSESRTLDARDLRRKLRSRRSRSMSGNPERNPSVFSRIRRDWSESPRHRSEGRGDGGVFNRLGGKGKSVSAHSESRYHSYHSRRTDPVPKKRYHEGKKMNYPNHGYSKRHIPLHLVSATSNSKKKSRMPNNVKTYDGSDDLEDHLKIFQAAAKVERWAMSTWCHM
ncbi:hypothetical protein Tco_1461354 [Tanacetum coccineum]